MYKNYKYKDTWNFTETFNLVLMLKLLKFLLFSSLLNRRRARRRRVHLNMLEVAFLSCGSRSGSRRTSSRSPITPIFSSPFMSKSWRVKTFTQFTAETAADYIQDILQRDWQNQRVHDEIIKDNLSDFI